MVLFTCNVKTIEGVAHKRVRVKESKNKRQISKKIFAFAFVFGRSEHTLRRVQWEQTALGSDYTSITVQ